MNASPENAAPESAAMVSSPPEMVHLHVKTHYSLLESTIQIPALLDQVAAWGQKAVAIADQGNLFGAAEFYLTAKAKGIQPILGCEVQYGMGSRLTRTEKKGRRISSTDEDDTHRLFQLVLLVKNATGYRNLCELVSKTYSEGLNQGKPRADRELISSHAEGLICLTAGLKGELSYRLFRQNPEKADACMEWLQKTFKDDLFIELQDSGLPEQQQIQAHLLDLAQRRGLGCVAAAQAHYLKPSMALSQEALMCISAGRTLGHIDTETSLNPNEFYLKDPETMARQFSATPEALANTLEVAKRCRFDFKLKDEKGRQIYHLPQYQPAQWADPQSEQPRHGGNSSPELVEQAIAESGRFSVEKYLRLLARKGLEKRWTEPGFRRLREAADWEQRKKSYEARLTEELDMIEKTGFAGYFLIVADFILYAKSQGIPVGPGRGSGAGSLVAYCLEITDIDPLPFNLLFERFINPERISMPDFDVDFCQDRRSEVIDYVVRKYGRGCVSQIITFGKLLAKSVIRDVGRVMDMSYADVDALAKLIPDELGIDLEDAFQKEPKLQQVVDQDPKVAKLFEMARTLEGLNRNAGIHAAGVIITNEPLTNYCPLFASREGEAVAQFDKDYAEKIGLIKFDFLGLKTLTVIDNAVRLVRQGPKSDFSLLDIDYEDPQVYQLLSSGDTDGVFQLESSGMKDLCQRVMPSSLEDITSINALYRPGPLESGMVDDFINRKHGRTPIEYPMPQLEPILNETYGVIVYQEQVMRVARVLAGYSLGEADLLRRAMGKKKPEEMAKQKDKFISGCLKNEVPQEKADGIFELLAKFASYGFNKSHSAAYGVLSFQTAYLKRYYPAQFIAALMATEMDNTDKLAVYIADARARGIEVLPPDINESEKKFSVVVRAPKEGATPKECIRFGLEAIKGVGGVAVDVMLKERSEKGPFKGFVDFCKRVPLRKVNKKVLECLIQAGAYDSHGEGNRASLMESLDQVMKHAQNLQEQAELGQFSMFDDFKPTTISTEADSVASSGLIKLVPDWPESKRLQLEKQLVGYYVSGHPVERLAAGVKDMIPMDLIKVKEDFEARKETFKPKPKVLDEAGRPVWDRHARDYGKYEVTVLVVFASLREIVTKKGSKMAFAEVEDAGSKMEAILFPEPYQACQEVLSVSMKESLPVIVVGQLDLNEEGAKLFVRQIQRIEEFQNKRVQALVLKLDPARITKNELTRLRQILLKHRGKCMPSLEYEGQIEGTRFQSRHSLPVELAVHPSQELIRELQASFGTSCVRLH